MSCEFHTYLALAAPGDATGMHDPKSVEPQFECRGKLLHGIHTDPRAEQADVADLHGKSVALPGGDQAAGHAHLFARCLPALP